MSCHDNPSQSDRMSSVPICDSIPEGDEVERAIGYTVAQRREVMAGFFSRHGGHPEGGNPPGDDSHPLGVGRALEDFQEWEIRSGRVADGAGSPWWSIVNGILVHDLVAAGGGGAGPWQDYLVAAPSQSQAKLWAAHQYSIGRGAAAAEGVLVSEVPAEQAFIEVALGVVETAAVAQLDTSRGSLGRRTEQLYPRCYPCGEADLERLRSELHD